MTPPQKKVETVVRLLRRAAGSGAKAPLLAARPITICHLDEIIPLLNTLYMAQSRRAPQVRRNYCDFVTYLLPCLLLACHGVLRSLSFLCTCETS